VERGVVESRILLRAMHVPVSVAVDVVAPSPCVRWHRSVREKQIDAMELKADLVAYKVPAVLDVPRDGFLIVIAAHENFLARGAGEHGVNIYVISYAYVAEVDEDILARDRWNSSPEFILPVTFTAAPCGELFVGEVGI